MPVALEPITREGARGAARDELAKGIYQEDKPGLLAQLVNKLLDILNQGLQKGTDAAPGGIWGLLALAALVIALVVFIRLRSGPLARRGQVGDPFGGFAQPVTPDEHRRRADQQAAAGEFADAVRERMRAIIRDLEERAVIEPRLGRTADEVADEAGTYLPATSADLHTAARVFDDVWYGKRPATPAMYADLRDIDRRVQATRVPRVASTLPAASFAVPR
ncbi:MAG: DUF4129 domain-containing protein [Pseudonocardiales bacterium]